MLVHQAENGPCRGVVLIVLGGGKPGACAAVACDGMLAGYAVVKMLAMLS
jgi:hypothetical protein